MIYRLIVILLLLPLSVNYGGSSQKKEAVQDSIPASSTVLMPVYEIDSTIVADTLELNYGDSVFIYSGELYFRARVGQGECFISRAEILTHADSLVVYQNLRLQPGGLAAPESVSAKVDRQRCTTITKNGTRCKRPALPGSDKCWQHKK
jgi:hypothetical protein